jgi:deoxyribodipyrimidine photo-lyase
MSNLTLFWHRRDLRIDDNIGLYSAYLASKKLIACYCFDPVIFDKKNISPAKVTYLIESLKELQENYRKLNSELYILQGNPEQLIPDFAQGLNIKSVYWNLDIEPHSKEIDQKVTQSLKEKGIVTKTYWDQLLHSPGEILSKSKTPYTVYTPFWKNWELQTKPISVETIGKCEGLNTQEKEIAKNSYTIDIPTPKSLGFVWDNPLFFPSGEKAAQDQLEYFCHDLIELYQEQRNIPSIAGTSRLSTPINLGVISIRKIWQSSVKMMEYCRSDESLVNIQTWQKELAWREFYQHALYYFPQLTQGAFREPFKNFPWDNNPEYFEAWCAGKTGYPIVDAAMRELNETGWMHNRCRMIVASFLTKDLMIDWRWGEEYFMKTLIDGDLAANNGGWQWSASSGMDPKPLRIFNPASQAMKFDPEGEYIRFWVREISSLDTSELVTGKIPELTCYSCGYSTPIVDHNIQQKEFKQRYNLQKIS